MINLLKKKELKWWNHLKWTVHNQQIFRTYFVGKKKNISGRLIIFRLTFYYKENKSFAIFYIDLLGKFYGNYIALFFFFQKASRQFHYVFPYIMILWFIGPSVHSSLVVSAEVSYSWGYWVWAEVASGWASGIKQQSNISCAFDVYGDHSTVGGEQPKEKSCKFGLFLKTCKHSVHLNVVCVCTKQAK